MTHVLKWLFWSEDTFDGQVDVVGDDYFFAGGHRNFSTNDDLFAGAEKMDRIDLKNDFCQVEKGIRGKRGLINCGQICRFY